MDRTDALLKELHLKDAVIAELKAGSKKDKDLLNTAYKKITSLQGEIEGLKEALRKTKKAVATQERRASSMEKKARVHINRSLSVMKEPQRVAANRILVLEWIVRELSEQRNLPANEIISLSEICTENDPMLKNILQEKEEEVCSEDLIDYLDKNGVKSILGIDIDQSIIDD
ncbi:hypothetical protein NEMIN01_2189 [Nematocida minor]|uniref:uncharacterized protein n=1 Tax=Nematocida minor TaxID=1912983 RepID=UPI00221FCD55|nr:uncharacterized protein NEMIN01_2189 [Nematocida minor]KAI5192744.1 hypothetical protein NEMIN01_2189 [Nematocida minor]